VEERPPNPVPVADILRWVERLDRPPDLHDWVSLTGGEPLLHPAAVGAIAAGCSAAGRRVHVETGGHRPDETRRVLDAVDAFTPDLKLESATGQPTPWEAHEATYRCLEQARKARAVKAVVGASTQASEVARAAAFAWSHLPSAPFVLQPVTPYGEGPASPPAALLLRLHTAARSAHEHVRVVPQVHRMLGVR
jgi:organic radical activating enzyme